MITNYIIQFIFRSKFTISYKRITLHSAVLCIGIGVLQIAPLCVCSHLLPRLSPMVFSPSAAGTQRAFSHGTHSRTQKHFTIRRRCILISTPPLQQRTANYTTKAEATVSQAAAGQESVVLVCNDDGATPNHTTTKCNAILPNGLRFCGSGMDGSTEHTIHEN